MHEWLNKHKENRMQTYNDEGGVSARTTTLTTAAAVKDLAQY